MLYVRWTLRLLDVGVPYSRLLATRILDHCCKDTSNSGIAWDAISWSCHWRRLYYTQNSPWCLGGGRDLPLTYLSNSFLMSAGILRYLFHRVFWTKQRAAISVSRCGWSCLTSLQKKGWRKLFSTFRRFRGSFKIPLGKTYSRLPSKMRQLRLL